MNEVLDRTQAPKAQNIEHFKLLPAQSYVLANGMPMTYFSGGAQELAHIQLEFEGGKLHEKHLGVANAMSKMIGEGTRSHTGQEISEHFDAYGAFWQASSSTDYITFDFACLSKYLGDVLPMVCEILQEANMPEGAWGRVQATSLQQLKVSLGKSSTRASRHFKERLFGGDHPYGSSITEESIQSITTEPLQECYNDHIAQAPFHVFLAGLITEEHLQFIDQTLGQLPIKNRQDKEVSFPVPHTNFESIYEEKADGMQSSLRIGKLHFMKSHPDFIPFTVLNTIFGGYFGSRLMQNIREEKGLTYGIYSGVAYLKHSSFFYIQADVIKEKREEAIAEIHKEMQLLKEEPVAADELERVKSYLCGSLVKSINSPNSVINCHKNLWLYQLPSNYYDTYTQKVWAVTASEIQEMANKYFDGPWVETVVG